MAVMSSDGKDGEAERLIYVSLIVRYEKFCVVGDL
jgi:hypothetical protein